MCDIPAPIDGLGIKFSLRMTMALALSGEPTSALHVYSKEHAARPDLVALRDKVASVIDDSYGYRGAGVTVHLLERFYVFHFHLLQLWNLKSAQVLHIT